MAVDWSKIMTGVGGAMAGYGGTGPQYLQMMQRSRENQQNQDRLKTQQTQDRQQQGLERQQAVQGNVAKNIEAVGQLIDAGRIPRAKSLLNESILSGGLAGGNDLPVQLKRLLDSGTPEGLQQARSMIEGEVGVLRTQGVLDQPAIQQPINVAPGNSLFDPESQQPIYTNEKPPGPPRILQDRNGLSRYVDGDRKGELVFEGITGTIDDLQGKDYNAIASGLRAEVAKQNGEFEQIANSWDRITASAHDPSAAGDLALIFNFMKMLDPGSTVREGEFATAQNTTGIPGRILALYNNAKEGTRLTETQRRDFFGQSQNIFDASSNRAGNIVDQYTGIGGRLGIRPEDIFVDRGAPPDISDLMNQPPDDTGDDLTPDERLELEELRRRQEERRSNGR